VAPPGRLPLLALTRVSASVVDRSGPRAPLRSARWFEADGVGPSCRHPGPGSITSCRLTSRQSLAPMCAVRWSMRPWASVRPRPSRRQGLPRSHGPGEETFDGQEVNLRLTADGLRCARATGGAGLARAGGRPPGRRAARPPACQPLAHGALTDAEIGGNPGCWLLLIEHATDYRESPMRRRAGILVDVDPGLRPGGCRRATTSLPGLLRTNHLHSNHL
jgi:hypothetical protein